MSERRLSFFIVGGVLAAAASLSGCAKVASFFGGGHEAAGPAASRSARYRCPMHPSYTSDVPGDCPICGMRLVPIEGAEPETVSGAAGRAGIVLSDERRQRIGVRTGLVEKKRMQRTLRVAGRVEVDETRLATVSPKFGGWIEELFVRSTGEEVRAGEPLFSVYSPELIEAQQSFLVALASASSRRAEAGATGPSLAETALASARERLSLLDFSETQIRDLEARKEVPRVATFTSRFKGVVLRRTAVQGARFEPGADLFELADLDRVWVVADVYEDEIPLVRVGLEAKVEVRSLPGEPFDGRVGFVYPSLGEATRTVRVRVEIPNESRKLAPGMFAAVLLSADLGEHLVIDDEAVLDTGTRQLVFVDRGEGRLEPKEIRVGPRADGRVAVLSGLAEGERVVTSGNFLVDSESRLQAALHLAPEGR
jgi:Cu(I)/Ag(I) efflux system membrane fusion protein